MKKLLMAVLILQVVCPIYAGDMILGGDAASRGPQVTAQGPIMGADPMTWAPGAWLQSQVSQDSQGRVTITGKILNGVSKKDQKTINNLLQKNCAGSNLPQSWSLDSCARRVFYFVTKNMQLGLPVTQ